MSKNTAAFGIYHTRAAAEEAVAALRHAGFRNTDISALFPDNAGTKDFALEKNTKAPEGTAAGATSGAVAGGVIGFTAGPSISYGMFHSRHHYRRRYVQRTAPPPAPEPLPPQ